MNKLIGVTIVFLLVLFLFLYTNSQKSSGVFFGINKNISASAQENNSSFAADDLQTDIIPLKINHGQITSGARLFQISHGHMIVLQITSDEAGDFYVGGYDKHVLLQKGKMVVLSFLSTINGRFPLELLSNHKMLGTMMVRP